MALPDPKMHMTDTLNKLEKNKMFEFDAHSDAIWSIDESSQLNGVFSGILTPASGSKLTQTRIASASSDGTVKLWNINTDGIAGKHRREDVVYHKMLKEFKHTPSIASSVVKDWNSKRLMAIGTHKSQYFKPVEKIKDKWEDSDIPTSVIFDPMNVANLIVGYVSGDLVRYDIEKGESNQSQIGQTDQSERIISLTKSLTATHYQTQDTISLLVSTNHGYLHIVDPREFQTLFSYKAQNSQRPDYTLHYNQSSSIQQQSFISKIYKNQPYIHSSRQNSNNYQQDQKLYPPRMLERSLQRNENQSPLEMRKEDLKLQFSSQSIFTSSTYLQYDCLIAASTNYGKVLIFDLRMADKGQDGIVGEQSQWSQHKQIYSEGIIKVMAHPTHPVLVTAGVNGYIKTFSSKQL
ncbi:MAG: hypothetical protein EZS28_042151 [Streblomastix strix]|uniref:Uncharacterized protein n=1 Tax=Streblomastix strix TaxID=222440 RepID=A0A5J4TWV2_9EUKA|nr:MAG: hypothetical protein EZS28_042151 [Streblomastix strix]